MNSSFLGEEVRLLDSAGPPRFEEELLRAARGSLTSLSGISIILSL